MAYDTLNLWITRVSIMKTPFLAGLFVALSFLLALPAQAQFGLFKSALVKGDEAYEREDFDAAFSHYTRAAKKDDADAPKPSGFGERHGERATNRPEQRDDAPQLVHRVSALEERAAAHQLERALLPLGGHRVRGGQ